MWHGRFGHECAVGGSVHQVGLLEMSIFGEVKQLLSRNVLAIFSVLGDNGTLAERLRHCFRFFLGA